MVPVTRAEGCGSVQRDVLNDALEAARGAP